MGSDMFHLMAILKQMHKEIDELKQMVDELREDVKVSGSIQLVLNPAFDGEEEGSGESDSESDGSVSVQSAPATVSYER